MVTREALQSVAAMLRSKLSSGERAELARMLTSKPKRRGPVQRVIYRPSVPRQASAAPLTNAERAQQALAASGIDAQPAPTDDYARARAQGQRARLGASPVQAVKSAAARAADVLKSKGVRL